MAHPKNPCERYPLVTDTSEASLKYNNIAESATNATGANIRMSAGE
jgi:hypothetical protein